MMPPDSIELVRLLRARKACEQAAAVFAEHEVATPRAVRRMLGGLDRDLAARGWTATGDLSVLKPLASS
jgi:hypothetical protein